MTKPKIRVPGEAEGPLDNIKGTNAATEEAAHEESVRRAVAEAKAREDAETQAAQARSQKGAAPAAKEGAIYVPPIRLPDKQSKYGPELPYPHGTPLTKDLKPVEGVQEVAFVVGRILGPKGWLVQRAIPIAEAQAGGDAAA